MNKTKRIYLAQIEIDGGATQILAYENGSIVQYGDDPGVLDTPDFSCAEAAHDWVKHFYNGYMPGVLSFEDLYE